MLNLTCVELATILGFSLEEGSMSSTSRLFRKEQSDLSATKKKKPCQETTKKGVNLDSEDCRKRYHRQQRLSLEMKLNKCLVI